MPVTAQRRQEVTELLDLLPRWAAGEPGLVAVGLCGSWTRGTARMDSDVDLVLLTATPECYTAHTGWFAAFAGELVRSEVWGPMTERRLRRASGLEIEFGIATPTWAATYPIDPGTREVVTDGFRPLHDPTTLLATLQSACVIPHNPAR
jgi:uncharacterized protein